MARWAPARKDTLGALADEILHNYGRGRVIVAVDGEAGSGMAQFADDLAQALHSKGHTTFRASISDFHRPRAERSVLGVDSAAGLYRNTFDYSVFRRVLVEPFRMGGSAAFVTAAFDSGRDAPIEPKWITGPDDAILLVDGIYLHRPEIRGLWNFSIWVDVPAPPAPPRHAEGSGDALSAASAGPAVDAQRLYRSEAHPRRTATAILDNTDPEHPRRVFADSC